MIIQAMPYPPAAGPAPINSIIVGFGASNLAGYSTVARRTDNAGRANLYQIPLTATVAGAAALATERLSWAYEDANMVSSALAAMGRTLADNSPGGTFVMVPAARYNTSLNSGGYFDPAAPGALYTAGKNGIDAAEAELGSTLAAIVWGGQGRHVQDGFAIATSKATLEALIDQTRSDQLGLGQCPFIALGVPYVYNFGLDLDTPATQASGYQEWYEYLRNQQLVDPYWGFIHSPVRFINDSIDPDEQVKEASTDNHLEQEAIAAVGVAAATLLPLIAGLTAAAPDVPTVLSDSGTGWLKLEIPPSGLTKIVLRYRQNGTADAWVEIDRWPHWRGQLPGETMYCNIPDTRNVALEVQVKAVSYGGESAWSASQVIAAVQRSKGWRMNATALNGLAACAVFELMFAPEAGGPDMLMLDVEGYHWGSRFDSAHPASQVFDGRTTGNSWLSANNAYSGGTAYVGAYFNEPTFCGMAQILCGPDASSQQRAPKDFTIGRCAVANTLAQCKANTATWTPVITVVNSTGWALNEVRTFTI